MSSARVRALIEPPTAKAEFHELFIEHGSVMEALSQGLQRQVLRARQAEYQMSRENQSHHDDCLNEASTAAGSLTSTPRDSLNTIMQCDWGDPTPSGLLYYIGAALDALRSLAPQAERDLSNQISTLVHSEIPSPFRARVRRRLARGGYAPDAAEIGQMWRTALLVHPTAQATEVHQIMLANWWPQQDDAEQLVRESRRFRMDTPATQAIMDQALLQLASRMNARNCLEAIAHGL